MSMTELMPVHHDAYFVDWEQLADAALACTRRAGT